MKTKFIKTLAMALTVATAITATAVPTHAEETGTVVPHYTVGQDGTAKNGEKYVDANGNMIKNAFVADGAYTYFVQNDGTTMKNRLTYHPNGVSVIYFDENGHEVFDNFVNVKHSIAGEPVDDLCYFNTFGEMYVDVVTYDKTGTNLYYANPYGVIERNGWFTYSDLQGGGIGYANADGTLLKNQYTTDTTGNTVYMEGDGSVRGSHTGVKHEHNWKPHYTTVVTQEAYDETTRHIDQERYMKPTNFSELIHQKALELGHKLSASDTKDVLDEAGVPNLTEMVKNLTPEEKQFYINYVKNNTSWSTEAIATLENTNDPNDPRYQELMEIAIEEYLVATNPGKYVPHETLHTHGFDYKLKTPIHHDAVTEQVINYYYCDKCGHTSMTKM
ncbi:hypothetical protein I6E50_08230 [Roseburia hominis]|uniref:hypothetical protein n=1 Tax=Roseburia hominis TaxID=301301 RepID=UPI001F442BCA|nr:hypothetical protein [Roseburia hominis]